MITHKFQFHTYSFLLSLLMSGVMSLALAGSFNFSSGNKLLIPYVVLSLTMTGSSGRVIVMEYSL